MARNAGDIHLRPLSPQGTQANRGGEMMGLMVFVILIMQISIYERLGLIRDRTTMIEERLKQYIRWKRGIHKEKP